jgi:hypothetical protein
MFLEKSIATRRSRGTILLALRTVVVTERKRCAGLTLSSCCGSGMTRNGASGRRVSRYPQQRGGATGDRESPPLLPGVRHDLSGTSGFLPQRLTRARACPCLRRAGLPHYTIRLRPQHDRRCPVRHAHDLGHRWPGDPCLPPCTAAWPGPRWQARQPLRSSGPLNERPARARSACEKVDGREPPTVPGHPEQ